MFDTLIHDKTLLQKEKLLASKNAFKNDMQDLKKDPS